MNVGAAAPGALPAEYFDGTSARAHAVRLQVQAGELLIEGDGLARRVPLSRVRWPERQRHGTRRIVLDDGGTVRCTDAEAFDAFARAAGAQESITVRVQQSWRYTLAAVLVLVAAVAAGYRWGLPAAARGLLVFVPASVDQRVGTAAYDSMAWLLQPTQVPAERQQRLRRAFEQAAQRASFADARGGEVQLRFHAVPRLGANAFALPGGTIVLTDELLQRLPDDDVVLGVLAHELGHVRQRHGMRLLVQTTLLGAATSVAFGDFSTLLAGVPALLGQLAYSRDLEREADGDAIILLHANGISPLVMITLFDAIARPPAKSADAAASAPTSEPAASSADASQPRRRSELGIAFSSHPADHERIERFRAAAAAQR